VADCRAVLQALGRLRRPFEHVRMHADEVSLYAPDRASLGRWPTFVADAARALSAAGVRFEVERTLPAPSLVNETYNAYVASHFDEFSSTGELEFREGLLAVVLGLVSAGRLDKRVHPTTGAILTLMALGRATIYRDAARWEHSLADLRERMRAVWAAGRLLVTPTSTSMPPRHGRSALDWSVLTFTKLGNLVDATGLAIPFGHFEGTALPRSLQILGPPGSEQAVLDLAERLQRAAL
jgi:Asp-tRNA(Asn)/Glu-tRNA(Gln) amidotransferase A subunit family amidase